MKSEILFLLSKFSELSNYEYEFLLKNVDALRGHGKNLNEKIIQETIPDWALSRLENLAEDYGYEKQ